MAALGYFGGLVFEVSDKKILTFNEFTRENSERWTEHEIDGHKPIPEYLGPGLDTISFTVEFNAYLGVNPLEEMDKLVRLSRNGEAHRLMIGKKGFGYNKWYITSVSQAVEEVDHMGRILSITTNIELGKYP